MNTERWRGFPVNLGSTPSSVGFVSPRKWYWWVVQSVQKTGGGVKEVFSTKLPCDNQPAVLNQRVFMMIEKIQIIVYSL